MKPDAQPAQALAELRSETREFLAKLEPSDLELLHVSIMFMRRVTSAGIVVKWLAIVGVAIVVSVVTFGESVSKILSWFRT
jgi:hypothetical protein